MLRVMFIVRRNAFVSLLRRMEAPTPTQLTQYTHVSHRHHCWRRRFVGELSSVDNDLDRIWIDPHSGDA